MPTPLSLLSDLSYTIAPEKRIGPFISERVLWQGKGERPQIALTFDDGPDAVNTPRILEVLHRFKVKATFFLIGEYVRHHFELAEKIALSGHEIANHSYSHPALFRLSDTELRREIQTTHELLQQLANATPKFLRPPMGLFSSRVLDMIEAYGYKTVIGDVYPRDSHLPGQERILERVLQRVERGSIIILHDGGTTSQTDRSQTVWAVQHLIPRLQQQGFEFVTLSELYE